MIEVRKIIKIENGREVLLAEYLVEELNDYKRNPLIKVLLPILSYEESFNQLCYLPEYHPNKKNLSIHLRYHALLRLTRFFQPVNQTLSLEVRLSRFIRDGYVYGNPLQKQHVQTLNDYHLI